MTDPDRYVKLGLLGTILVALLVAVRALWAGPHRGEVVRLERWER